MILDEQKTNFIIEVLKCFFILVFFGMFLPKFIDLVIYNLVVKSHSYDNSIFVYNIFSKNIDIIYNYITVFNEFIKF
ncbi:endonuclease III [Clostridium kluyveri]|uniref:Endonuclease III n=1 Tax=Clostridium kluyveri TaxID=1534 RepID=A0A1L5F6M1_CLOKL|nr:endonuclease III [Clostridium kluyveri]APM38622.1 endonuclease III [Clostridium kluyveri]UZQ50923.1 endonuclease III [Clostridium kluyveri]